MEPAAVVPRCGDRTLPDRSVYEQCPVASWSHTVRSAHPSIAWTSRPEASVARCASESGSGRETGGRRMALIVGWTLRSS